MIRDTPQVVTEGFTAAFGREPEGVWSAPGRVSLAGDHTDIEDGLSFAYTYQQRTAVAAARRDDRRLVVRTDLTDEVVDIGLDDIAPPVENAWFDYPLGMVWAALGHLHAHAEDEDGLVGEATGLDVYLTSDVPIGGGLGSSSSICAALAVMLNDLWGLELEPAQLAKFGYRVENDYVGASSGIADHMTILCGEAGKDVFFDARGSDLSLIDFPPLAEQGLVSLLIQTGEVHRNWQSAVAERHDACDKVARELGYQYLREVPTDEFEAAADRIDPDDYRRARYVIEEIQRVLDLTRNLRTEGAAHIGPLLNASQQQLKNDFEVTTPRIDLTVDVALRAGALGARMSGAGFGGTVYALVPLDKREALERSIREAYAEHGWDEPVILASEGSAGARRER